MCTLLSNSWNNHLHRKFCLWCWAVEILLCHLCLCDGGSLWSFLLRQRLIPALILFQRANTAVYFAVWSIFPCLWIPLVKNTDHTDAPSANCWRSRFVVAYYSICKWFIRDLFKPWQLQSGCGNSSRLKGERHEMRGFSLDAWASLKGWRFVYFRTLSTFHVFRFVFAGEKSSTLWLRKIIKK